MKKFIVLILLCSLCGLCSGCFMVFAVGNNDFRVTDRDTVKTRDISTQADTKVTPIP